MTQHPKDADRPPEPGAPLLDHVQQAIERYVILPTVEALWAVVLWIAATHDAPAWNTAPRLLITGPEKRCGKSRLLDVVEAQTHRPVMTVNASPSAIYRSIATAEGDPPTILIDEGDTIFGPNAGEHEDLRGLLNAGHQRNRPALRWDVNSRAVEELDTYAMAAIAGIGRFPDTIEDRAVKVRMRRRAPGESVQPYRLRRDAPALHANRIRLHRWARTHHDTLATAEPEMPLEDRAADTWEALIIVADTAGGHWPERARQAALTLTAQAIEDDESSIPTQLLADLRTVFDGRRVMRTADMLTALKQDPEAPWSTHGTHGLNARSMAQILKEFGIKVRKLRIDGNHHRGYASNDFIDAWSRYLPPEKAPQAPQAPQPQVKALFPTPDTTRPHPPQASPLPDTDPNNN